MRRRCLRVGRVSPAARQGQNRSTAPHGRAGDDEMKRRTILQALPAVLGLPVAAQAQAYPSRPIRYIVPVAAGGGSDMIARVVTERWGRQLGQSFVVDNQGGGGGVIASQAT